MILFSQASEGNGQCSNLLWFEQPCTLSCRNYTRQICWMLLLQQHQDHYKITRKQKPVINYSTQLQNIWVNIEKKLEWICDKSNIKDSPLCKWLLASVFFSQWSPVVFIENVQIFWAAPLLEMCSCACQVLSGAFYQIDSVCLLSAGCAPALSSMISGCKQQSVQLIAGWVSVPLGSLLLSNMSSQASCFYTWHITVCWQINLWALNGTQQDNVTQNNNVIHAGGKKIPLKNRDSLKRFLATWCERQNMFSIWTVFSITNTISALNSKFMFK